MLNPSLKNIFQILFKLAAITGLAFSHSVFSQQKILTVVPQPKEFLFTDDKFLLNIKAVNLEQFCRSFEPLRNAINELDEELRSNLHISIKEGINSTKHILIGLPDEDEIYKAVCSKYNILPEAKLGDEGYKLLISTDTIFISAKDQKGLFYGLQTLKQIVRGLSNKTFLPGLRITDYPSLKIRGVMDDISRGPVPKIEFIKYQIRRLAEMKINMLNHYVENVVKTKSHPEFSPDSGSITIDQWKELAQYATKYNITLVGGFQSFGHFNNILKTPEYAHLGESGTLISPVLPESYKFLEDIYSEMIPAFNAPYFNINCDETFDLGKSASKKLVDSIGYANVYFRHIMKLYNIAKNFNTGIIMWGDVLLEYPQLLTRLPKDVIVATWAYDNLESYSKHIQPLKDAGVKFFVSPGVLNSNRIFPDYIQTFGNIKGFVRAGIKAGADGMLLTTWDDGGKAMFSNDWYGIAYAADKSWNPESNDSTEFDRRFNRSIYGSAGIGYTKSIRELEKISSLEPADGMNDKILFEKLLPDSGMQIRISVKDWDRVLKVSIEAEKTLSRIRINFYKEDREYIDFVCILYQALALERLDLIKAANLYAHADSLPANRIYAKRNSIKKVRGLIDGIIRREKVLNNEFVNLWKNENTDYALDRVTDKFDEKINDFDDVKTGLMKSLSMLNEHGSMLSQDAVRLSVSLLPGKYFREWLMINPFPNKDGKLASQTDYLSAMGGEKNAAPKVTQELYSGSEKHRWFRTESGYQDVIDLSRLFPEADSSSVTYAFANIESETDTVVTAELGVSGGIELFINGKTAFSKVHPDKLLPDEFSIKLPLQKGANNLLLKITRIKNNWGFSFRLPGCEVRSRKNRYKILTRQEL